ncbi:porin [Leptolyngbya sp. PL-A2]|nr:porin [Leptolyngbya sp. FACHB-60]
MKPFTQLKKLSLVAVSALVLTAAVGGVAAAAPCLVPNFDCPFFNCD